MASSTKTSNPDEDDNISRYKQMLALANAEYEELSRSQHFLGQRDNPTLSPYHSCKGKVLLSSSSHHSSRNSPNKPHKWGAPQSPEQFRPDDWLGGSGHSVASKHRSYTPKSGKANSTHTSVDAAAGGMKMSIPTINLDDDTAHSVGSFASSPQRQRRFDVVVDHTEKSKPMSLPMSASTSASTTATSKAVGGGYLTPTSSIHKSSFHSVGSVSASTATTTDAAAVKSPERPRRPIPPQATSVARLQAESKTPVMEKEKINQKKFLNSFALFERALEVTDQPTQPRIKTPRKSASLMPCSSGNASTLSHGTAPHRSRTPRKSTSMISPRKTAYRNFKVPRTVGELKDDHRKVESAGELSNLEAIIENLRKVNLNKKPHRAGGDASDEKAAELLAALRQLRKVTRGTGNGDSGVDGDVLGRLRTSGVLQRARLRPEDAQELRSIRDRLVIVRDLAPTKDTVRVDLAAVVLQLEQAMRLYKQDSDGQAPPSWYLEEKLEDAKGRLKSFVAPQLEDPSRAEVQDCCVALQKLLERLQERDESDLAYLFRQLDDDGETASNGLDDYLRRVMGTLEKQVPQQGQVEASKTQQEYEDELAGAIQNLKRARLNKWEAHQVSGILFSLRKTKYPEEETKDGGREMIQLRRVVLAEKMNVIEDAVKTVKKVRWNLNDEVFEFLVDSIVNSGVGEPTRSQVSCDEIADAIQKLKKVQLNEWEAKRVSVILVNLKTTQYPENEEGEDEVEVVQLKKVVEAEKMEVIEQAVRQIKRVRWNLDNEVFEFFVDDVVAIGAGEPTPEQLALLEESSSEENMADAESVDTMDITLSSDEDGDDNEERGDIREKSATVPAPAPAPKEVKSKNGRSSGLTQTQSTSPMPAEDQRKIVFTRKHHWKHKQHNATVIGEKRWRKDEAFGNDDVVFSPLSREQFDRRKAVGASLLRSMETLGAPLDMELSTHVDEVERKLQENDLNMGEMERKAASSKRAGVVVRSPKRSPRKPMKIDLEAPSL